MPIVPPNPAYPGEYGPNPAIQPVTTQLTFQQGIGEVLMWNPDIDPYMIGRWLNNHYRQIIQMRYWYGCLVQGQLYCPQMTTTGSASVTQGSNTVTGTGTGWTQSLIGQQFRIGYMNPWQTIVNVNPGSPNTLTLDMPFGGVSVTSSGYQISQVYFTLGANVTRLLYAKNQQQGWPMYVNVPQQSLDAVDTWRASVGWSKVIAAMTPTPDGQTRVEVWPSPFYQQVFPYAAYVQPSDWSDANSLAPFMRADILVNLAISDALTFRGRQNKYYDPQEARRRYDMAMKMIEEMERQDDCQWPQDSSWSYGAELGYEWGEGSLWAQNHPAFT
jgi:hypothetical protein